MNVIKEILSNIGNIVFNKKKDKKIQISFDKIEKTINSCENLIELTNARNMIYSFLNIFKLKYDDQLVKDLNNIFDIKKDQLFNENS